MASRILIGGLAGIFIGYAIGSSVLLNFIEQLAWTTFKDSLFNGGKNMFGGNYFISADHYFIFLKIGMASAIGGMVGAIIASKFK